VSLTMYPLILFNCVMTKNLKSIENTLISIIKKNSYLTKCEI